MRIEDTLTEQQRIELFSGNVVGLFTTLILPTDAFYDNAYSLCAGYYTVRSASKTASKVFDLLKDDVDRDARIGSFIRSKFIDKWNRVYNALVSQQYNPINNIDISETKTGNNSNVDTHNTIKKKTSNNSDTTTYNTTVQDDGKSGVNEIRKRDANNDNNIYGFNSTVPVGDTLSNEDVTETFEADFEKNITSNTSQKTGTEEKLFGVDETDTHTGTDSTDITINEAVTKSGRDLSPSSLIEEEINLRNTQIFFDIIYSDIDSIATLQIYL